MTWQAAMIAPAEDFDGAPLLQSEVVLDRGHGDVRRAVLLTWTGHLDDAYALLMQTECPSWLYPVTMGATTIWERWDSMLPDGSINPGDMTSFNHYALGAVADWMHRTVGGIAPLEPGYRRTLVAPRPGGGLTWADSSLDTPYGPVRVSWHAEDDRFTELEVTVPGGTTATLSLPDGRTIDVTAGHHHLTRLTDLTKELP